ncbi:flagellar biosynthetic protein FliO [Thiohalorhabdus methylotrophus]|uniref:Flagellar protein n=1 Tax=Thiohalorhabdus methylotrophus TaxID=3242694 RepID=A0ABV4TX03_9GAMM
MNGPPVLRMILPVGLLVPDVVRAANGGPDFGVALVKMLVGLGIVLGLFALGVYALKRFGLLATGTQGEELRVERMISLGYRNRLAIVRAGNRRLLVGVTAGSVTRLADLSSRQDGGDLPDTEGSDP